MQSNEIIWIIVLYIRVSTERQVRENASIADQKETLTRWASENGHKVIKIYEDAGVSGFKGNRPKFEEMLRDIETGKINIDCVAVYDSSRFSRNERTRLRAENIFEKHNVKLFSLLDCVPDDVDDAFLFKGFNGLFNESFSRKNSKKSALKLHDISKNGFFTGGVSPYGYKSIPAPAENCGKVRKVLAINPDEEVVVKLIFSLAAAGQHGKPYGLKKISTYLNEKNITRRNRNWSINFVHRLLTNSIYYGEREIGKKRIRTDLNHELVIVECPPIITKEDFFKVRSLLKLRAPEIVNRPLKGLQSDSLLTGLLKCRKCQCNLVINTGKSGKYSYYKCKDKIHKSVKICNCPTIPKQKLENAVLSQLKTTLFTPDYIATICNELKGQLTKVRKSNALEKAKLQKKWNLLDEKVARLIEQFSDGKIKISSLISRHLKQYEDQLNQTELNIKELDSKSTLPLMRFGDQQINKFSNACNAILLGGNIEASKGLLIAIVDEIIVDEEKLTLRGGKLQLLRNVSKYKAGNQELVPSFITNWRRGWDSNPR
jgi:site-specific DNA recombinase